MTEMKTALEKITAAPGILAAYGREGVDEALLLTSHGLPLSEVEKNRWLDTLRATCVLLDVSARSGCGVDEVRVVLGHHTVLVQQCDGLIVGVVFVKGDGVVKSLGRMVRKTFRRLGKTPGTGARTPSGAFVPTGA